MTALKHKIITLRPQLIQFRKIQRICIKFIEHFSGEKFAQILSAWFLIHFSEKEITQIFKKEKMKLSKMLNTNII